MRDVVAIGHSSLGPATFRQPIPRAVPCTERPPRLPRCRACRSWRKGRRSAHGCRHGVVVRATYPRRTPRAPTSPGRMPSAGDGRHRVGGRNAVQRRAGHRRTWRRGGPRVADRPSGRNCDDPGWRRQVSSSKSAGSILLATRDYAASAPAAFTTKAAG